jgi:hypothetical protein
MNNVTAKTDDSDIPEYTREQLGKGVRGKYFDRVQKASNVVVIETSLSKIFPNSAAVNDALQRFVEIAAITSAVATRAKTASRKRAAEKSPN